MLITTSHPELREKKSEKPEEANTNRGKLKIDATVAVMHDRDPYIRYPNDLSLVNEARIKTEQIIDLLFEEVKDELSVKFRTYRKVAHQRYLQEAKKRQKTAKSVRKTLRYLLNYVERNLGYIDQMLDMIVGMAFPLAHQYQQQLWVFHTLYEQQRTMHETKTNHCDDRIISISQPHVRPIVRGKQGKAVELGAKLSLSLMDGYLNHETLSLDNYNEGKDLQKQTEAYRHLFGHYPEFIQADKIYAPYENRSWCRERNIRLTATPKGRPAKKTARQKHKEKKEYAERNHIEGKIGNSKQALSLNQIKAKLKETSHA